MITKLNEWKQISEGLVNKNDYDAVLKYLDAKVTMAYANFDGAVAWYNLMSDNAKYAALNSKLTNLFNSQNLNTIEEYKKFVDDQFGALTALYKEYFNLSLSEGVVNENNTYYQDELNKLNLTGEFAPVFQFRDNNGVQGNSTKWITLNKESADALVNWLCEKFVIDLKINK